MGLLVWDLLDGSRSVRDICSKVEAEYDIDAADCAGDVMAFLQDLAVNGLVVLT